MDIELGIVEGFYGRPWTAAERHDTIAFLARHGYRFHIYAPKADPYLRRRWQEDHPPEAADQLASRLADKADARVQGKALNKRLKEKYGRR